MLIRRFFAFVISAFLIFFPAYSYATTSVGGWTATDSLIAGANTTINAAKTAGGKALKSSITVAASASKVGKHLIKGGGSAALAFAMVELADGAIDWVLDPANNSVRWTVPAVDDGTIPNSGGCPSAHPTKPTYNIFVSKYDYIENGVMRIECKYKTSNGFTASYNFPAGDYNPPVPVEKSLPIDVVASKVIANAAAGHAPSQEAVKAVALEGFAAGEHDAALDAAATEVGTENPPDTENPPTENPPLDPTMPFDPSSIIAAINALGSKISSGFSSLLAAVGLTNSKLDEVVSAENATADAVTAGAGDIVDSQDATTSKLEEIKIMLGDFFDLDYQAPDDEEKNVPFATTSDVRIDNIDKFEQRITFSGQCPSNEFSFSMMGVTYAKPIPYHHLCGFLEQIAPWLLAMCYLGTAYFVVENI